MITTAIRKGRFARRRAGLAGVRVLGALRSRGDRAQLAAALDIGQLQSDMKQARERFANVHRQYISSVSTEHAAASLETSALLAALVAQRQPSCILDLGSGFSTYVLNSVAPEATVVSIDDDADWRTRTEEFCDQQGVRSSVGGLAELDALSPRSFDLIFHDLSNMHVRLARLEAVLNLAADDGLVVLDDVHKTVYRRPLARLRRREDFRVIEVRDLTLDDVGRWAAIAVRQT